MSQSLLNQNTLLKQHPDVFLGDVDGEAIALNVAYGTYLHLNETGRFILSLLIQSGAATLQSVCESVQHYFDVEAKECQSAVSEFVTQCMQVKLLQAISTKA